MNNRKNIVKILAFLIAFCTVFSLCNDFFRRDWNADAVNIYDEPRDTVEVLFIGSSMTEFGIDVMTLYEEYGICAYNLGNSGQPVSQSYYWLEEAYKYQSGSLKTVVFDVSIMRTDLNEEHYRNTTENMELSSLKYEAVSSYAEDLNQTIAYMFPLFSYHTKWDSLKSSDFGVPNSMLYDWTRGQCVSTDAPFSTLETEGLTSLYDYALDETAPVNELDPEGIEYFLKMQEFCEKNDLELILIKTPNPLTWNSSDHNTFVEFAKDHNVEFLDFNFAPLLDEIGYDCMFDSMDAIHLNYYGAQKLAMWMGNYLIKNNYAQDIRDDERYAFMEEDLAAYNDEVRDLIAIRECVDPVDYISLASKKENYVVFITVKYDGAKALTDEQREGFSSLGLNRLSGLSEKESYLAVIENGKIICDWKKGTDDGKLRFEGELENGLLYSLVSAGVNSGDVASCKIEGSEYACGGNGLNIVLYDMEKMTVVDRTVFDTNTSSKREVPVWDVLKAELANVPEGEPVPEYLKRYVDYMTLLEKEE